MERSAVNLESLRYIFTGSHIVYFHSGEIVSIDVTAATLNSNTYNTGLNVRYVYNCSSFISLSEVIVLDSTRVAVRSPAATVVLELTPLKEVCIINTSF